MDMMEILRNPEPLDPELQRYMEDSDGFGPILKHPLVFAVPYTEGMNPFYNRQFKAKKEYIERKISEGNWSGVIWLYERPYRFWAFQKHMGEMDDATYWQILGSVWTDTENLWQYKSSVPYLLTAREDSRQMMDDEDRALFDLLPDEVAVYRGYQTRNRTGWAWSLSEAKALWFARRWEPPRYNVVRGFVKKTDIVGVLMRRNEFEVIANPKDVKRQKIMTPLERPEHLEVILGHTKREFKLPMKRTHHGPEHWQRVERNAVALCQANPEADMEVCRLFAIIHDCKRQNEDDDPQHGHRAAEWIQQNLGLLPDLGGDRLELLLEACKWHNDGRVSEDPTIGTCWDADRLDLPRVGITPDPNLLSTETARKLLWRV